VLSLIRNFHTLNRVADEPRALLEERQLTSVDSHSPRSVMRLQALCGEQVAGRTK
jgi:hypothetical protein